MVVEPLWTLDLSQRVGQVIRLEEVKARNYQSPAHTDNMTIEAV